MSLVAHELAPLGGAAMLLAVNAEGLVPSSS